MIGRWFFPVATVGVLVAPLLGCWFGESFFFCELLSHFPVQYAGLAGLLLSFWLGKSHWGMAFLAFLGLILNGWLCIGPFLATPPLPVARQPDLRVFHANVLHTRTEYRPLIDTIRRLKPDFFVLQELTSDGIQSLAELRGEYPYQDRVLSKDYFWILVGSRTPFTTNATAKELHRVLFLTGNIRGQAVSLLTVHTRTPLLPDWFAQRNKQLTFVADQLARVERPAVLVGDFNISVFSPVYQRIFANRLDTDLPIEACRTNFGWTPPGRVFCPYSISPSTMRL